MLPDDDGGGGEGGGEEQDDMRVMKEAHKDWSEDQYYGGSNVTALVQLDEYEREDDALVITMNNIHKTYLLGVEGVPALRGVSMSVRRGEFLIIYGTSGGTATPSSRYSIAILLFIYLFSFSIYYYLFFYYLLRFLFFNWNLYIINLYN